MPTYVAFLRAINLGAKRKFPKDDIVAATEAAGGADVLTHINTGNVRLTTRLRSRERVEEVLEAAYAERAGFEVPTIAYTTAELAAIAADARELSAARPERERHYVYLLKAEPDADAVAGIEARSDDVNQVAVRRRAAHILLGPGYQAGNVDPFRIERSLGIATNRNYNVVTTLADTWCP